MRKSTLLKFFRNTGYDVDWSYQGGEVEFLVRDIDGDVDLEGTEAVLNAFTSQFPGYGGYRCGYGAWVVRKDYEGKGNWGDKGSQWHY